MLETLGSYAVGGAALFVTLQKLKTRAELSLAKHRSLTGHPRMARRAAALLPAYSYDATSFYNADGAPAEVLAQRRAALQRMVAEFEKRYPETTKRSQALEASVSDMQFINHYRVPFQFMPLVRELLKVGSFFQSSEGVTVTDLDGNRFYDLTGSFGVNVFGNDFYKQCIAEGSRQVQDLGPVRHFLLSHTRS